MHQVQVRVSVVGLSGHECRGSRQGFDNSISKVRDEWGSTSKSRNPAPVLDSRFQSQLLVLHVDLFQSLNVLARKAV